VRLIGLVDAPVSAARRVRSHHTYVCDHLDYPSVGAYVAGRWLWSMPRSNDSRSDNSPSLAAAGLPLMVVGMSTYLLGNLFQLAVSRKREHAADTSGAGIFEPSSACYCVFQILFCLVQCETNSLYLSHGLRYGAACMACSFIASQPLQMWTA